MYAPLLSALLSILAFNSVLPPIGFFALVPLFLFFFREQRLARLIQGAFLFRLIFLVGTVYFVGDPFLYASTIGIFLGLPVSIFFLKKYASERALKFSIPALWVLWDYCAGRYTILPVTLVMFGNSLAETSFVGLARLGGSIALTAFIVLVNMGVAVAVRERTSTPWFVGIGCVLVIGLVMSRALLTQNKFAYDELPREAHAMTFSLDYPEEQFTLQLVPQPFDSAELLIMPEGAYANNAENADTVIGWYQRTAQELGRDVLAVTTRKAADRIYTSSMLISRAGEITDWYDKYHLTITSEYWPFGGWHPGYMNLEKIPEKEKYKAIFDRRYQRTRGGPKIIQYGALRIATPICSELHYPDYLWKLNQLAPDVIVHNSNNNWITHHAEQYERLTNRIRAITAVWLKKPVVASGIQDVAGIFYPDGTRDITEMGAAAAQKLVTIRYKES